MTFGGGDHGPSHDKTSAQQLEYAALFGVLSMLAYFLVGKLVTFTMPTHVQVVAGMGVSALLTSAYARRQIRIRTEKQAKITREYNEMMEVNTQKQIDAMLRGNSKIPKVKR